MGFNQNTGVYTPASGALSAAPGQVVQSAVWDNIFTDMTSAFTAAMQALQSTYGQRNIIGSNGGLEIWQRGTPISINASTTAYTADRWYLGTNANQACTVTQATGITTGSQWAAKVQRNNAQIGVGTLVFGFPIDSDECAMLAGQTVALSFTAKAGANWSPASGALFIQLNVGTGSPVKFFSGFTNLTQPIATGFNLTSSAQRFTVVSTVIPTNTTQAEVSFVWIPVGTAGADDSFTIDDVQLEILPSATSPIAQFERWSFERMFAACKRHFWKTFRYGLAPAQNAGSNTGEAYSIAGVTTTGTQRLWLRNPVSMRGAPNVTTFNPSATNAQIRDVSASGDCSSTAVTSNNNEAILLTASGNGSTAVGNLLAVHVTADSSI